MDWKSYSGQYHGGKGSKVSPGLRKEEKEKMVVVRNFKATMDTIGSGETNAQTAAQGGSKMRMVDQGMRVEMCACTSKMKMIRKVTILDRATKEMTLVQNCAWQWMTTSFPIALIHMDGSCTALVVMGMYAVQAVVALQ